MLLIGWWWGKWKSASSNLLFQLVWGLHASEQHTVNFSHLVGISVSAKLLKDIVMYIRWWGTRTLPQGCTVFSLDCSSLVSHLLLSLISNCLNLPVGTQEMPWRLNEAYFLKSKKWGTQEGFCTQKPHRILLGIMAEYYSNVFIYQIFFIHSSVDGHIGCFHNLAIVNNGAVNIGSMYLFRLIFFFFFWIHTQEWNCWITW